MALTDYSTAVINTSNPLTSGLVVAAGAHRLQNIVNGAALTKVGTVTDAVNGWTFSAGSSVALPDTPLEQFTAFALAIVPSSGSNCLVGRTGGSGDYPQNYFLRTISGTTLTCSHKRAFSGAYPSLTDPTPKSAGAVVAAAYSFDGATQRLYANGTLTASQAETVATTQTGSQVTQIGAADGSERAHTYSGSGIQLVLIWNRALSDAEQASLAANPDQVFNLTAGEDTTPPTLSAATATATGQTTITGGVTTTEAGPAWAVLTSSTTKPSAAQIKAGQNASGVASPAATATLVVGANPGVFAFTGLTASTGYYLHVTQDDTATTPNTAAPVTSALVTTNAAPGVITLPALRNNTGTLLAYETGATVHAYAVATGNKVVSKTGQVTDAAGVMVVSDMALVAGTEYRCVIVLASGAEGLQKATAA